MPVGIIINVASVIIGGLAGSLIGSKITDELKQKMNWIFGVCAMGMGISSIMLMQNMPAVVFSVIAGTLIGLTIRLGAAIEKISGKALARFMPDADKAQAELLLTAAVLFCASGTGIYGSLDSGMTGNHSILIAKSVLDLFTSMIFACQLGKTVSLIGIPQFAVMISLFLLAKIIVPLTNASMIQDFKACGGFLLLATGFRMMQLRAFPVADMIPAMVLVMPVSYVWTEWIMPLII